MTSAIRTRLWSGDAILVKAARKLWETTCQSQIGSQSDVSGKPCQLNSRSTAAASVGMGHSRYEMACQIVAAAEVDPESYGDLIERMDTTGNVTAAQRELRKRKKEKLTLNESRTPDLASMTRAELVEAWSKRFTDKGQTPPKNRLWKLDRTARAGAGALQSYVRRDRGMPCSRRSQRLARSSPGALGLRPASAKRRG
mgnify:CR=1 FL=1